MQQRVKKPINLIAWSVIGSVALHMLILVAMNLDLALPEFDAEQEETVSVEVVPEPEPEPAPEPQEEPEPEEPEPEAPAPEEAAPPPPPAPPATMLALRPPPSDAPESETAMGNTQPEKEEFNLETGPEPEATVEQAEAPVSTEDGQTTQEQTAEPPVEPVAKPELQDAAVVQADEQVVPEVPEILAVEGQDGSVPSVENPPVPLARPEPPSQVASSASRPENARSLTKADRLLSNNRFNDPMMREALGQLPLPRRIVQLCTAEALSQIMDVRPGTMLHGMVPFGDHNGGIQDNRLDATGGAYRTMAGDWYDISFQCSVNPQAMQITAFSYHLGDKKIPRNERLARGLPAD